MAPNAIDYIAIQNTISRYCIALDTKNFDLLKQVFTEDVDTVYPFGGQRRGVQPIIDAISKRLLAPTNLTITTITHNSQTKSGNAPARIDNATYRDSGRWQIRQVNDVFHGHSLWQG